VTAYADTSWWIGYKIVDDWHHGRAASLFAHFPHCKVVWTPWQRVEVFNHFRQLERGELIASGASRNVMRLLEHEVRLGYWPHREFSGTSATRAAVDIVLKHGLTLPMRGMDVFHVAIARVLRVDAFLTFDAEQRVIAVAAGLKVPALG
jgi:hypothetical protein